MLVEVQALVAPTDVVPPRRVANGIDRNRLSMILAVLARHGGPSLGLRGRVRERRGRRPDRGAGRRPRGRARGRVRRTQRAALGRCRAGGCFGEIGLTGELRYVAHADRRLEEAARFGLERIVLPARCADDELPAARRALAVPVPTLSEALAAALGDRAERRRAA